VIKLVEQVWLILLHK